MHARYAFVQKHTTIARCCLVLIGSDDMNFDVCMLIFRYIVAMPIPEAFSVPKSVDFHVFGERILKVWETSRASRSKVGKVCARCSVEVMELAANGCASAQTQVGSEGKVYLSDESYD